MIAMSNIANIKDESNLLTVGQAGLLFKPPLSPARVRQLVDRGDLLGIKASGGLRLVYRDAVLALVEQRRAARAAHTQSKPMSSN